MKSSCLSLMLMLPFEIQEPTFLYRVAGLTNEKVKAKKKLAVRNAHDDDSAQHREESSSQQRVQRVYFVRRRAAKSAISWSLIRNPC